MKEHDIQRTKWAVATFKYQKKNMVTASAIGN